MYAIFIWAAISTFLATLNWVITLCVFGTVMVTLPRIKTEELILIELFGERYVEYLQHVLALGCPWQCLGFDDLKVETEQQGVGGNYNAIETQAETELFWGHCNIQQYYLKRNIIKPNYETFHDQNPVVHHKNREKLMTQ